MAADRARRGRRSVLVVVRLAGSLRHDARDHVDVATADVVGATDHRHGGRGRRPERGRVRMG
jgi:hypothetical protein